MTCDRCANAQAEHPVDGIAIRDKGGERRAFMACDGCHADMERSAVRRLTKNEAALTSFGLGALVQARRAVRRLAPRETKPVQLTMFSA